MNPAEPPSIAMLKRFPILVVLLVTVGQLIAAPTPDLSVEDQVQAIIKEVRLKSERTDEGRTPDLQAELKALDALYLAHRTEKTDAVGEILVAKARLYLEVLDDARNGLTTFKRLANDLPEVSYIDGLRNAIANLERRVASLDAMEKLKPGAVFPDFKAKDFAGKPFSLSGLKGKVVLVDFWATWCRPCVEEMPELRALRKDHGAKGFEIVGVNLDDNGGDLKAFMRKEKLSWPIIPDPQEEIASTYGAFKLPTKYLIGRQGLIVGKWEGGDKSGMEKAIAKELARK